MENLEYKKLVEAALFMSPHAMSPAELSKETGIASIGILESVLQEIVNDYKNRETAIEVVRINEKYMFGLKEPYASKVSSLASGPDITKGALRLLAYLSRNDGVVQSELVKIFGASTYDYVKELAGKEFVEAKKFKRSKRINTTTKFKEYFKV